MIRRIKSSEDIKNYDESTDLKQFLLEKADNMLGGDCLLVVYKYNEVYIGSIFNKTLNVLGDSQFSLDCLIDIRMFSERGELHLWKSGESFKWRLRIDEEIEGDINVYEETHFMWGTSVNKNELKEEHRGMKIRFPCDLKQELLPLKYDVRNYFTFDDDGMIYFYDARIVKIIYDNRGELNGF